MKHELKTDNKFMSDIISGKKTFEVRKNDRGYAVGDTLLLKGWYTHLEKFNGEEIIAEVTYLLPGGNYGIAPDHCVMGIQVLYYSS